MILSAFMVSAAVAVRLVNGAVCIGTSAGPHPVQNAVAFCLFAAALLGWCAVRRVVSGPLLLALAVGSLSGIGVLWVAALASGEPFAELLAFGVGRYACWGPFAVGLLCAPVALLAPYRSLTFTTNWRKAWVVAGSSGAVGFFVYFVGAPDGPVGMMIKATLIVVVPAFCLCSTAMFYHGRWSWLVRGTAAALTVLLAAVGTMR